MFRRSEVTLRTTPLEATRLPKCHMERGPSVKRNLFAILNEVLTYFFNTDVLVPKKTKLNLTKSPWDFSQKRIQTLKTQVRKQIIYYNFYIRTMDQETRFLTKNKKFKTVLQNRLQIRRQFVDR